MKVPSPKQTFWERIYLTEVFRGLGVTIGHLLRNLFRQDRMPTVQFPEEAKPLPVRHRSRHRLTVREDGTPKCVACMCCPTACPASCIHIVAEEADAPWKEKRPRIFEIDLLRCVYCGYCVEACPEDAIRMDTDEVLLVGTRREDFIVGLDFLMHGQGKDWRRMRPPEAQVPRPGAPAGPPQTPEEEGRVRTESSVAAAADVRDTAAGAGTAAGGASPGRGVAGAGGAEEGSGEAAADAGRIGRGPAKRPADWITPRTEVPVPGEAAAQAQHQVKKGGAA